MKLLRQFSSTDEAEATSKLLRGAGVLTSISGSYASTHKVVTGTFAVSLWVIVDSQFEDASKFLNNPASEIQSPLSEDEMRQIEAQAAVEVSGLYAKLFSYVAGGFLALAILGFVVWLLFVYRASA